MAKISQEELEKYLWGAAELLRGSVDAGSYKQYVFPLLFFKRLCDVYDEESQTAIEESGDPEAANFEETHSFAIPKGSHWSDIRKVSENVGESLVGAFSAIERANSEKLSGIFGSAAWTNKRRLPDRLLKDLIEHFSSKTLSLENCPEDELGNGYEYLIKKFADDSGHTAQEFYTNRTVVHLMTKMLKPKSDESVYDPTCGTGGMLISCIAYLQQNHEEWRNVSLYGQEITGLTCAIGRMNLFLHGVEDFHIVTGDTLEKPAFIENGSLKQFDIVLANPPYSIKQWDRAKFEADKYGRNFLGTPPQGRADYAFIAHICKSLKPKTGRAAILLPHGILFRDEENAERQALIESDLIDGVIGLAPNLFYNSPMEACILLLSANKNDYQRHNIFMINAVDLFVRKNAQNYLSDDNVEKISSAYLVRKEITGFSKIVSLDEVKKNNYKLSLPLYIEKKRTASESNGKTMGELYQDWIESSYELDEMLDDISSGNKEDEQ